MEAATQATRFATSRKPVFRGGVKPHALIGQKLSALFEVPSDSSAAIDALLQQLERKTVM